MLLLCLPACVLCWTPQFAGWQPASNPGSGETLLRAQGFLALPKPHSGILRALHSPLSLPILHSAKLLQIFFKLLVQTQRVLCSSKHRHRGGMYLLVFVFPHNKSKMPPLQIAKIIGNREYPKGRVLNLIPPAHSQACLCTHTLYLGFVLKILVLMGCPVSHIMN